jgi:hypothetical protein
VKQLEAATTLIEVTVTFPLAERPFHGRLPGSTSVGEIRRDAMAEFGAVEDPQHAYYLSFRGTRQKDDATLAEVAENARAVKFTLVKELIQG